MYKIVYHYTFSFYSVWCFNRIRVSLGKKLLQEVRIIEALYWCFYEIDSSKHIYWMWMKLYFWKEIFSFGENERYFMSAIKSKIQNPWSKNLKSKFESVTRQRWSLAVTYFPIKMMWPHRKSLFSANYYKNPTANIIFPTENLFLS